jgi:DNA repair exonuclease SbcCD ATPase subunit
MADENNGQEGSLVPAGVGAVAGAGLGGWAGYVKHRSNTLAEAPQAEIDATDKLLKKYIDELEERRTSKSIAAHVDAKRAEFIETELAKKRAEIEKLHGVERVNSEEVKKLLEEHRTKLASDFTKKHHSDVHMRYIADVKSKIKELNGHIAEAFEASKQPPVNYTSQSFGQGMRERFATTAEFREVVNQARKDVSSAQTGIEAARRAWQNLQDAEAQLAKLDHLPKEVVDNIRDTHIDTLKKLHHESVAKYVDAKHNLGLATRLEEGAKTLATGGPMKGKLGMIAGGAALGAVALGGAAHILLGRGSSGPSHAERIRMQQAQAQATGAQQGV